MTLLTPLVYRQTGRVGKCLSNPCSGSFNLPSLSTTVGAKKGRSSLTLSRLPIRMFSIADLKRCSSRSIVTQSGPSEHRYDATLPTAVSQIEAVSSTHAVFYDPVRPEEIETAWEIEKQGKM